MSEINHRTLAPLHCASDDEARPGLCGLHFAADGSTVGTNGHLLARTIPAESSPKLVPFTLAAGALAPLVKDQRKKKKSVPPAQLDVDGTNAGDKALVIQTLAEMEVSTSIPKLEGEFPDWRNVVPTEPTHFEVMISAHVLESMLAAVRQFTETRKGDEARILFCFHDVSPKARKGDRALEPVKTVVVDNDSGDRLECVLMPMRI